MLDANTVPAVSDWDEDRWEAPVEWWELAVPTRGIGPGRPITANPTAAADIREPLPDHFESHLALLAASAATRTDLELLAAQMKRGELTDARERPLLYTALARLGPECAAVVDQLLDTPDLDSARVIELLEVLAHLPSDEAFAMLLSRIDQRYVAPVLARAVDRFPRRALRLLAPRAEQSAVARVLLRSIAQQHPELAADAGRAAGMPAATARTATVTELPDVLRMPPWQRPRSRTTPFVRADLVAPRPDGLLWVGGEREEWAQLYVPLWFRNGESWTSALADARSRDSVRLPYLLAHATDELARPLLATVRSGDLWDGDSSLRRILARFGEEALPYVTAMVQPRASSHGAILAPVTGTAITLTMIRWLDSRKARAHALAWFDRHLATALPDVIAAALATPGKNRTLAASALRTLADRGHRPVIDSAAAEFGDQVAEAISLTLDADPLLQLPARIPALPKWLDPQLLPPVALRDGGALLPVSAVLDLCVMLSLCGPQGDYAGVAPALEALEPDSRAEFAWGLFENWRLAGYPSKDGWVLHALGLLGNDETARRLGPWIRRWPGESGHARATAALDTLLLIGTDIALMQLHNISEKVKFKGIRTSARERIAELAAGLELTPRNSPTAWSLTSDSMPTAPSYSITAPGLSSSGSTNSSSR